ncbi:transcriptional regulator [Mycobacteroides stephanolepidis]|uniref:Transcriptional regulator n=1 Tax=[Mycobacterium] stephanolepidis TaxID=1520670 RepID=A0A1Z4EWF7_9MYCO|nr:transcriptional regulator [[Mycobacterium] stephanolepidis]
MEAAQLQGISARHCLAGTGLTSTAIDDSTLEIEGGQELAVLRNILQYIRDPHLFARDVGSRYNFASTGILGYALLASSTLGDALNIGCRYATLSSTFLTLTRYDTADGAVIEIDDRVIPGDLRVFLLERGLYALMNMMPVLFGQLEAGALATVTLPNDIDIPLAHFEAHQLSTACSPSGERAAFLIPEDVLALPMPAADAATAQLCVQQCEDLLQARRRRRGISARVRTRLVRDPGEIPSMALVAQELGIAERTLHRRLAGEHTSYRALVDEVRGTLASALLDSGLTVEETARQLGYSETSGFTRAFIRWTGAPPSRYRRRPLRR